MSTTPLYLAIADALRTRILNGTYADGTRLPSEAELMAEFDAGRQTAIAAVDVLNAEGLVIGRPGIGKFVRRPVRLTRAAHGRDLRATAAGGSPFAADAAAAGYRGTWTHATDEVRAAGDLVDRLAVPAGTLLTRTRYRFYANGEPIQLSTSWEPAHLLAGTVYAQPEGGPVSGVVARYDAAGIRPTHVDEYPEARAATPAERVALALPPGGGAYVLHLTRTYHTGRTPIETADIVFAGDRYRLSYRVNLED
jgi:GntR family transcriptional regulator